MSSSDEENNIPVYKDEKVDPETGVKKTVSQQRGSFVRASIARDPKYQYEDPFSAEDENSEGTKYRTLEWWQAGMIMIAETISLGILSLPSVLARVGMVAGIVLIIGMGIVATYAGFVIGQFRRTYPWIHTFADAGEILFTPLGLPKFGKELFGAAQVIFLVFIMASHVLVWTIMLNTITNHGACTLIWAVIGLVIFFVLDLPRTMKNLSYFSIASACSVFTAVLITMVGVGADPPEGAMRQATVAVPFVTAFNSVSNIVFAYAGHVAFFSFIAELKHPEQFTRSLILLQSFDTSLYLISAIVIYYYAGNQVQSPALGSASPIVSKVAWGVAIPTIIIAGVIYGHVSAKYIYVRLFRGTKHLSARSFFSYGVWAAMTFVLWIVAWIIAESIPVFNDLLSLISALFASWFTFGLPGIMWMFMNKGKWFSSPKMIFLFCCNVCMTGIGVAVCGIGLYTSGYQIHADSGQGSSWSCANNVDE